MNTVIVREKTRCNFALKTFQSLVSLGFTITISPSRPGSSVFIIPDSPFGKRSVFSNITTSSSGYNKGPISISGTDYYMSKDWYERSSNALCIFDNLKKYVEEITSGNYSISKDSTGEFLLEKNAVSVSRPSMSSPIATSPLALSSIAKECMTLLEANHNIILSGAPGTGKTYMAKQIALAMTGSEDRIGFVQFHPSYDYTDFVEGLRPASSVGGSIGFERKDGLFKEFCEKALKCHHTTSHSIVSSTLLSIPRSSFSSGTINLSSIRDVYYAIRDAILNGSTIEIETTRGLKKTLSVNNQGNIQVDDKVVTLDKLNKIFENCSTLPKLLEATSLRDVTGIGGYDNLYKALLIYIYKIILGEILLDNENPNIFPIEPTVTNKADIEKGEHKPRFVFIIDEINRGEMSKVFGELFFSIDPGYRGTAGKVRTQYANMVDEPNAFDTALGITDSKDYGHFFVPENVYIIGTMNDIDRSVDSMDFAMRRRFLIKDIKAEDTQKDMLTDDAVIAKMDALNTIIAPDKDKEMTKKIKAKLGSSYSLGASYFQKYDKYNNDFELLWKYHLEGILREYLRGTQDPDGDLKILKEVYENA